MGIFLSQAAEQKVLSFGSFGERVCYVRLEGPVCNLFFVATYLPHRGRVCPNQDDTIADVHKALQQAQAGDCIVLLGDLNEQLAPNIQGRTGRWAGGQSSKNADKILDIMHMYDLYAVNTHFEPKKGETQHTYMCPKSKNTCAQGDFGLHVGEKVACRLNGKNVQGEVIAVDQGDEQNDKAQDADVWTVLFEDGQKIRCGKSKLRKLLARGENKQEKKQIDHILVSNRWRSSVTQSRVRWGPSVHRSISGKRSDHGLVECTWKWRMRHVKTEPTPDFSVLQGGQQTSGSATSVVSKKVERPATSVANE